MPTSKSPFVNCAKRKPIHQRQINCYGYRREDGLWDIEGHLVDTKSYTFENQYRGAIKPGEALHDMWLRITVDNELNIHDAEAIILASPYKMCPDITDNYKKLIGLKIKAGWRREVNKVAGGIKGCTHLVELLSPIATTAFQTIYPIISDEYGVNEEGANEKGANKDNSSKITKKPVLLNSCHTYAANSPIIKAMWHNS